MPSKQLKFDIDADGNACVNGQEWEVPKRYRLKRVLGAGAYGCVCQAEDTEDAEHPQVALKRFENVFMSKTDALRILREISILRRLKVRHELAWSVGLSAAFDFASSHSSDDALV